MGSIDSVPTAKNIPDLRGNIEGLRVHSLSLVFVHEPSLSESDRKMRAWLLHTVASASRHYLRARELVQLQDNADQARDGGLIFYVLDVSEQIEDCVMSTFRACMAIKKLTSCPAAEEFSNKNSESIEKLRSIRNQFDHMHTQIVAGEVGEGPIAIVFGDEGRLIRFRKLSMDISSLHALIDSAYRVVATLFPHFNVDSQVESRGSPKLSMSFSIGFDGTGSAG